MSDSTTPRPWDRSSRSVLLEGLARSPAGAEAVAAPQGALAYGELREAAGAVARALPAGERVAVWAAPELATVVAVAGALAAGAPVVPLNPKSGRQELAHVLGDAGPAAVLAPRAARLPEPLAGVPRLDV